MSRDAPCAATEIEPARVGHPRLARAPERREEAGGGPPTDLDELRAAAPARDPPPEARGGKRRLREEVRDVRREIMDAVRNLARRIAKKAPHGTRKGCACDPSERRFQSDRIAYFFSGAPGRSTCAAIFQTPFAVLRQTRA